MQCPNCGMDYKDVKEGKDKGCFTQQNDHYYHAYRIYGYMCPNCGYHASVLNVPVKHPFIRSCRVSGELDRIVENFRKQIEEYYASRSFRYHGDLFDNEENSNQ